MAKTFYTSADIHDLAASGVTALRIDAHAVITMEAQDTARRLGLEVIYDEPGGDAPAHRAPVRFPKDVPLAERVRAAVATRIGPDADAELVAKIVERVLAELKSNV